MHDAAPVRAMMRWSVPLLLRRWRLERVDRRPKPGPDGGGGSNAAGAGGTTGGGGRGGGSGGAAGSEGGQSGGGGTGGCAPNQVWCPGCEPGTGACYVWRLSRRRVSSAGRRSRRVWIGRRVRQQRRRRSWRHNRRRRARRRHRLGRCWRRVWLQWPRRQRRWIGRHGWSRAVRRARVHEQRALRATQLRRHRSALQSAPRWRPMSDADGPIGLSATLHQHRGQAARSRRARLPLLSASRVPRRAAPRSPARASRRTSARPAEDAASSAAEKSFVSRPDHVGGHHHARSHHSRIAPVSSRAQASWLRSSRSRS